MRRNFKKPLIKVASVGMSIAMATTPMVAVADDEGDITNDITNSDESTGNSENNDVTDGVKEESVTPVADYVREVADGLVEDEPAPEVDEPSVDDSETPAPEADMPEAEVEDERNPEVKEQAATPEVKDAKLDENIKRRPPVEDENQGTDGETKDKTDEVKSVDDHLADSANALYDLADDVDDVERANDAAKKAADNAANKEDEASKAANADAHASEIALETPTDETLDAAKKAHEDAEKKLGTAEQAAKDSKTALEQATNKLKKLFEDNGITYKNEDGETINVTKEDLENLLDALLNPEKELDTSLLDKLDGNTKEAIEAANEALIEARKEAADAEQKKADAAELLAKLDEDLLTQIALKKAELADADEDEKDALQNDLAKLLFEYHLASIKGYDNGSVKYEVVDKDPNGNALKAKDCYTLAVYTVNDEVKSEKIYFIFDENDDLDIVAKIESSEEVNDQRIKEHKDPVYKYLDTEGNEAQGTVKKEFVVSDNTKVVVTDQSTVRKETQNHLAGNQTVIDGTQRTDYAMVNTQDVTVSTTKKQQFTDKDKAKNALKDAVANKADNQTVVLNVTFDLWPIHYSKDVNDVNGLETAITWVLDKFGSKAGLNFTLSTTTVVPAVEVTETVYANVTDTQEPSNKYTNLVKKSSAKDNADTAYENKCKELEQQGYTIDYSKSGVSYLGYEFFDGGYRYEYKIYATKTIENVKVSTTSYNGKTYTNTLVEQGQEEEYSKKTVYSYSNGDSIIKTADKASDLSNAKNTYDTTKTTAEDQDTVDNAKAGVVTVAGKVSSVFDAIKEVLTLGGESKASDSQLETIASIVKTSGENIQKAIEKKAALDKEKEELEKKQNEEKNQDDSTDQTPSGENETTGETAGETTGETTTTGGGGDDSSSSGGTTSTAGVSSTLTAAQPVQIPDAQTPLAGPEAQTQNVRRNGVAGVRTANANDANANDGAGAGAGAEATDAADTNKDTVKEDEIIDMIQIDDEEVAKAGSESNEKTGLGGWLVGLILALLAAAGITIYEVAKNKKKTTIKK